MLCLLLTHTLTLVDARVKRTNILKIKNVTNNIFDFLNVLPFSPKGFCTFLVGVANGAPHRQPAPADEAVAHSADPVNLEK